MIVSFLHREPYVPLNPEKVSKLIKRPGTLGIL